MENTDDSLGVRFSPKQSKSKTFCSVYGCNNSSARLTTTELTFDFDGQRNSVVLDDTNPSPVTSRENNNGSVVAMLPEKNDETPAKTFIDVGIQVKSGDLITDFCDVIKTEKELNTLTGIVSFDILNTILDVFKVGFPKYDVARSHDFLPFSRRRARPYTSKRCVSVSRKAERSRENPRHVDKSRGMKPLPQDTEE
ncbi:hypothetical protein KQX54_014994 [Cotesia glomerata]|uniref:Uncharacterized protein n=1 Tax=Cotesia glomerata TaxID=32391 RepID=A0AAV7II63_COTGL|nr:hypothetical protein KQX54_014994 [Cotesia glomerata]